MIDQLMRAIPTDQIARSLGTDEATAAQAVQAALPALLGGLAANSQSDDGARSLLEALGQHEDGLADQVTLDAVDTADGEKIVGHVFGGGTDGVVNQLGGLGGAQTSDLVRRLLPILAPIVLSWLAKQMTGAGAGRAGTTSADRTAPSGGSVTQPDGPLGQGRPESAPAPADGPGPDGTSILRDILGSALGGATGRTAGTGGGSILGDVLGGLLGGRR